MINEFDKTKVEECIKLAESSTSGEIVPVIVKSSDFYYIAHFRSAVLFSLLFAISAYVSPWDFADAIVLILMQVIGLAFGYGITFVPFVKRLFISKKEMEVEVKESAMYSFMHYNVHNTRDRTGILIYVSEFERRVELISDTGINEYAPKGFWDEIVNKLVQKIKEKKSVDGMCECISSCGEILSKYFPRKHDDKNELADNLRDGR